jgi:hypothetical protein
MQSHFFALNDVSEYYQSDAEPDEEDSEVEVLAAEKQPKIITKARKEVFDGVLVPSHKNKENIRPGPAGKVAGTQPSPTPNRPGIGTRSTHLMNQGHSKPMLKVQRDLQNLCQLQWKSISLGLLTNHHLMWKWQVYRHPNPNREWRSRWQ